jgi:hypothetical protein
MATVKREYTDNTVKDRRIEILEKQVECYRTGLYEISQRARATPEARIARKSLKDAAWIRLEGERAGPRRTSA